MKDPSLVEWIMGLLSVIVFMYRAFALMIPMIQEGIQKKNMVRS